MEKSFEIDTKTFIGGWYIPNEICDDLIKLFHSEKNHWEDGKEDCGADEGGWKGGWAVQAAWEGDDGRGSRKWLGGRPHHGVLRVCGIGVNVVVEQEGGGQYSRQFGGRVLRAEEGD